RGTETTERVRPSRLGEDWNDGAKRHGPCRRHRIQNSAGTSGRQTNRTDGRSSGQTHTAGETVSVFEAMVHWLKVQQRGVNQLRRRWQESCVRRGAEDPCSVKLL
ncbi:hypothetical protein LTR11_011966, partial [Exophiala xenobiotica]